MSLELPDLSCMCDRDVAPVPSVAPSVDQVQNQTDPAQPSQPIRQIYYQSANQCGDADLYQSLMNKYYSLSKNQRYALIAVGLYLGYRIIH